MTDTETKPWVIIIVFKENTDPLDIERIGP